MKHRDPHPRLWLALGVALVVVSQFRYGVGALAWLAPIGWLRYLRLTQGWRSRLLFLGAMWLAWSVAMLKIVMGSIPPVVAMGFGLPIGSVFAAARSSQRRCSPTRGFDVASIPTSPPLASPR